MRQTMDEEVSVSMTFNHRTKQAMPKKVQWQGRVYNITKIGLHHTSRAGRTLIHVFSVCTDSLFLRLELNTDDLHWSLKEVSDGLPE